MSTSYHEHLVKAIGINPTHEQIPISRFFEKSVDIRIVDPRPDHALGTDFEPGEQTGSWVVPLELGCFDQPTTSKSSPAFLHRGSSRFIPATLVVCYKLHLMVVVLDPIWP